MIVNIPARVMDTARRCATAPTWDDSCATRRADGSWDIDLPDATARRLEALRFEGETIADAIERVLTLHASGWRPQ